MIALDFVTKLLKSQGIDFILTITDHDCTKMTCFIPCREEINAEEMAALYTKHIFPSHRLPFKIISDRDPCFSLWFTRELCKILGIKQSISTVYHPCTDGQSEWTNQWLEQYLCFWANKCQDNWAAYLLMAEFTHNNWPNETMHESPFFLLMRYDPHADWTDCPSPIPQVALCLDQFKQAWKCTKELMIKAQKSWVKNKDMLKYKVGDQVWLEGHHLHTNQPNMKLAPRRHGLFKVVQVMSLVNYCLELPTQWSIHPVFHIDPLTPYCETPTHGPNYQCPPLDLIDREEEYEVENILYSGWFGRRWKLQYLVKWKGYPDSENQWMDKDDVFADKALQEFKRLNPAFKVHIRCLFIPEDGIPILTVKYMSSLTSSTIENAVLSSCKPQTIIPSPTSSVSSSNLNMVRFHPSSLNTKPKEQQGNPEWKKEQIAVQTPMHALVCIPSTSNISNVLCTHNNTKKYCHNCNDDIPPVVIPLLLSLEPS